jgi:hypothetical protein
MTDGWVDRNPWQLDEVAYLKHLGEERHMFAWCMSKYGGLAPEAARAAALDFYTYEHPSDEHRGLVFHDEAWHWAMLRLIGHEYWQKQPHLAQPSAGYEAQSRLGLRIDP